MNVMSAAAVRAQGWGSIQGLYVWAVMAGLLLQGAGSLLLYERPDVAGMLPLVLATVMNGNPPHAWLHVGWGAAGLLFLASFRTARARIGLGWVFGTFYTLLGFLGILVYHPLGMRLDLPENAFHLTVGPLMLLLTWLAARPRRGPAR